MAELSPATNLYEELARELVLGSAAGVEQAFLEEYRRFEAENGRAPSDKEADSFATPPFDRHERVWVLAPDSAHENILSDKADDRSTYMSLEAFVGGIAAACETRVEPNEIGATVFAIRKYLSELRQEQVSTPAPDPILAVLDAEFRRSNGVIDRHVYGDDY